MTLTIELTPETEARLRSQAASHGVDAAQYALHLLESQLVAKNSDETMPLPTRQEATAEECVRRFDEMIESFSDGDAPDIPSEALRRENMYEDRGL